MTSLVVHPQKAPLVGRVPVPADPAITHRALVLAALGSGFSTLRGYAFADETERTRECLTNLGVDIEVSRADKSLRVRGVGIYGLVAPKGPLACGTSKATLALLSGILCAQDFESELTVADALARTPLQGLVHPLRERGGRVSARGRGPSKGDATAPLLIGALAEEAYLGDLEWPIDGMDPDLKGALLLSGLFAHGTTTLREERLSPDYLERMFFSLDLPVRASGPLVQFSPEGWNGTIPAFDMTLPGDASAAALLVAAGCLVQGSRVEVRGVGTNVARAGFAEALRDMRAQFSSVVSGEELGEMVADLSAQPSELRPLRLGGEHASRSSRDLAPLAALLCFVGGTSRLTDLEGATTSPTILAAVLRSFGREAEATEGTLTIRGEETVARASNVTSGDDPGVVCLATLLALRADGPSRIDDVDCVTRVFPRFVGTLRALGASIDVVAS